MCDTHSASRLDPYKDFNFRVKWDGRYVAGVSRVSGLTRTTEVIEHREGGDPSVARLSPGRTKFDAITLERGVTHDVEFEQWANTVWTGELANAAGDFRKDLVIEVRSPEDKVVLAFNVYRAWVSQVEIFPAVDSCSGAAAIQRLKIENEGWEPNYDVLAQDSG